VREEDKRKIWRRPSRLPASASLRASAVRRGQTCAVRGPLRFGLRFGENFVGDAHNTTCPGSGPNFVEISAPFGLPYLI